MQELALSEAVPHLTDAAGVDVRWSRRAGFWPAATSHGPGVPPEPKPGPIQPLAGILQCRHREDASDFTQPRQIQMPEAESRLQNPPKGARRNSALARATGG